MSPRDAVEVNFDGLVGPTHNYAGLAPGNVASQSHAGTVSHPRAAALQGLAKMRLLCSLGQTQGVLAPPRRPDPHALAALGFDGFSAAGRRTAVAVLARDEPWLLATLMSASSMWAANAATVSPSADTADGRLHLTPANLQTNLHRSLEARFTTRLLRRIFTDADHFVVHDPLPSHDRFADEGAANHGRLARTPGSPGVELFVSAGPPAAGPTTGGTRFPRRQRPEAAAIIARSHGLIPERVAMLTQSDRAIDGGAFHNDVVAVTNDLTLFHHADAFADPIEQTLGWVDGLRVLEVDRDAVPLADAVGSYLFNSQLITRTSGAVALIAPDDVNRFESTAAYLESVIGNGIDELHTIDLGQSMRNGGGPACLRLRVVLSNDEQAALSGAVLLDDAAIDRLEGWVGRHYRSELHPDDLADPSLLDEVDRALDELDHLMNLPGLHQLD